MNRIKSLFRNISKRLNRITQWIWATVAIIGIVALCLGGLKAWRMVQCGNWPTVTGEVLTSELKRGLLRQSSLKNRYQLKYRYTLDGIQYHGDRISFSGYIPDKGDRSVKSLLDQYRPGSRINIHYHPRTPEISVVDTIFAWNGFKPLLFGLILSCLGAAGFWRRWPLQTDYLFRERDLDKPLTYPEIALGALGLLACLGIFWLWWELIKMYAGR